MDEKKLKKEKITWEKVFKDFKDRWPSLRKSATYWCPHSYATIMIYLTGGERCLYNYDTHCLDLMEKDDSR